VSFSSFLLGGACLAGKNAVLERNLRELDLSYLTVLVGHLMKRNIEYALRPKNGSSCGQRLAST
jgi:hypothetical protein